MADFAYRVLDGGGKERTGKIAAPDIAAARVQLIERRHYIVSLDPVGRQQNAKTSAGTRRRKLSARDLTLFTRQLSSLIEVSPLEEALRTISRQNEKAHVRAILTHVHSGVVEGQRLAEAMRREDRSFPPLYRAMVSAGESSGALPLILDRLANWLERQAEMRGKLISTLAYPTILALVAFLVVTLLMISVVPRVVEQFDGVDQQLPLITRIVIGLSSFLASWWWLLAVTIGFCIFVFWRLMQVSAYRYRVDATLLRLPVLGKLIRNLNGARIARTLATMVASRLPVLDGLALTSRTIRNSVIRDAVEKIVAAIRAGSSLSASMRVSGVFPPLLVYLVASGESAGQLETMLERAADYMEREFDTFTSTALSLLEPAIIVIMGGAVALIILSILLPILQLQNLTGL